MAIKGIKYEFMVEHWQYAGPSGWHFVSLPKTISTEIRNLFKQEEEARDLLRSYGGSLTGDLRVGAVGPYHATGILAMFNQKYPGINLTVTQGNSVEMVDLLTNYSIDVAVLAHTEDNPAIYADLTLHNQ